VKVTVVTTGLDWVWRHVSSSGLSTTTRRNETCSFIFKPCRPRKTTSEATIQTWPH